MSKPKKSAGKPAKKSSNASHPVSKKAVAKKSAGPSKEKGSEAKAPATKPAPKAAAPAPKSGGDAKPAAEARAAAKPVQAVPKKVAVKKVEKKEELPWEGKSRMPSLVAPTAPANKPNPLGNRSASTMRVAPKKPVDNKPKVLGADAIASLMSSATSQAPKREEVRNTDKVTMPAATRPAPSTEGKLPSSTLDGLRSLQQSGMPQQRPAGFKLK